MVFVFYLMISVMMLVHILTSLFRGSVDVLVVTHMSVGYRYVLM